MKITKLQGYEAPQSFFESELLFEGILCTSDLSSGGIGDYSEDDMSDYFN